MRVALFWRRLCSASSSTAVASRPSGPTSTSWRPGHSAISSRRVDIFRLSRNMSSTTKPTVVFVLGAPGAGKGTQCKKIVEHFEYEHLSAGDLLREERAKPNSEFGELIETHIREGSIVPVAITCSLLVRAMKASPKDHFLIDGFPRNEDNLKGWEKEVGDSIHLKFVLFFVCDKATCVDRCLNRGAAGSGRSDDNLESLEKRFDTYVNATMPIIKHFEAKGQVMEIDAKKSPDEVFEDVKKHFIVEEK